MKNRMFQKIKFFKDNFHDYLMDMKRSEHGLDEFDSNLYHSEGDVWTHTMAVCSQVQQSSDVVQWACLLHDIGKPDCRGVETKNDFTKVNFRNHGSYGIYKALEVLNRATDEFQISELDKILVLKLVSKHQDLYNGSKNYQAPHEDIFYRELYQVCNADSAGGISESFDRSHIGAPDKVNPEILKIQDNPNLVLLIGVQNSGKSTYYREYLKDYTKISRDDILVKVANIHSGDPGDTMCYSDCWDYCSKTDLQKEVDKILQKQFSTAIKNRKNIVIDMTNMSKKSRRKWLHVKNYNKKAVLFVTEYNKLFERNAKRFGKCLSTHVIKTTMKRLVWPDYKEFSTIDVKI